MPDKNLTDNEIVKALEICSNDGDCNECKINPHKGNYGYCTSIAIKAALDLINRQKTEIDENTMLRATLKTAKVEAYKEFAELLQNICIEQQGCLYSSDIGAVYNELTGEQNAQ